MAITWLYDKLMRAERFRWHHSFFTLRLSGQFIICLMVAHMRIQNGAWPEPFLLIGLLLFSVFFWRAPVTSDAARPVHLYLTAQTLIVGLTFVQDFLLTYLFIILAGQAVALLRLRTGLIWSGAFVLVTLYGNFYLHTEAPVALLVRAIIVSVGFIYSGVLSVRIAQTERDKISIQRLLAEITEAHAQLQDYIAQSRHMIVIEERNRLAQELHENLGHGLAASIMQLEAASRLLQHDPQQAGVMVDSTRAELTTGLNALRDTLDALFVCKMRIR